MTTAAALLAHLQVTPQTVVLLRAVAASKLRLYVLLPLLRQQISYLHSMTS